MTTKKKLLLAFTVIIQLTVATIAKAETSYSFDVKVSGKGNSSIIFIPGFACSGQVWDETKSNYEKDYMCYTLTMAGFAGVPAQANASFANWEKSIASFIIDKKLNKPILVGHSMGGGLAMAIAADYPDLISKIVVVDALPCLAALMDTTFKSNPGNDCTPVISQFAAMSDAKFLQMQRMTMPSLMADTLHLAQVVNWSVLSDRKTFAGMYCDFSNTDLRTKIASIKCPCLILLESSFSNYKPAIENQFKNLKTAEFKYASKGLHFIMYDDKPWFDQQLASFIKG